MLNKTENIIKNVILPGDSTLYSDSYKNPHLLIFLRHLGCTFCRETLAKLKREMPSLKQNNIKVLIIHMEEEQRLKNWLIKTGLEDVQTISDPERKLYRAFNLKDGKLSQLFGLKVWWRALFRGLLWKHSLGFSRSSSFQMPGSFLINKGIVVYQHRPESIAEEADFSLKEAASSCKL